ncbi:MAG: hypothetical protein ACE5JX_13040 [Acidobacteriota bacterium]
MRTISWILLVVAGLLIVLGSSASAGLAYFGSPSNDIITGSSSLADLSLGDDVATALRARRGTAASFGLGFATFFLFVVLGPYRKGAVWAWWAILCSTALLAAAIVLRVPTLGTSQGVATGVILLLVVIVALLLDVRRLRGGAAGA